MRTSSPFDVSFEGSQVTTIVVPTEGTSNRVIVNAAMKLASSSAASARLMPCGLICASSYNRQRRPFTTAWERSIAVAR